jgi:hypothetical protein
MLTTEPLPAPEPEGLIVDAGFGYGRSGLF